MTPASFTVRSQRTFNHPTERFANFQFSLEVTYHADPGMDTMFCMEAVHRELEKRADLHKARILADISLNAERRALQEEIGRINLQATRAPKQREQLENTRAHLAFIAECQLANDPSKAAAYLNAQDDVRASFHGSIGLSQIDHVKTDLEYTEQQLVRSLAKIEEGLTDRLPKAQAELASLPKPYFSDPEELQKQVHPGHPAHPDTEDPDFS